MAQPSKPVLQKPPGYRDPTLSGHAAPRPRPLPPRKPVLPPSFRPKPKRRSCRRICCCSLCILILVVLLFLAAAGGLFYLFFEPKLPVFHLRSFKIRRFKVTVEPDGTYLDAQTVVRIEAKNPNRKLTLYYGRSELQLSEERDGTELGSASQSGFTQEKGNVTVLKLTAGVKTVVEDGLGRKLKAGYRSKALVVAAEIRTRVGLGVGRWRIGTLGLSVVCGGGGDMSLKKLKGGVMPKCTIRILKWIHIH
ncbi:NDR1/HIN1-like protein 6 [Malania oleifera]|uniref:NDR1/HIN1-like protein 6 n=1 Tax=Malania oleifera TaxID=397392 RepID=UPI0025ADFF92|nr:NDR1/HIN1-like protein 6 [Malania oleifera]